MTQPCEFCDSKLGRYREIGDGMWFCDACEKRLDATGKAIADIFRGSVLEVQLRQTLNRLEINQGEHYG